MGDLEKFSIKQIFLNLFYLKMLNFFLFKMKKKWITNKNVTHKIGRGGEMCESFEKNKLNIFYFIFLKMKKIDTKLTKNIWVGWWEVRDLIKQILTTKYFKNIDNKLKTIIYSFIHLFICYCFWHFILSPGTIAPLACFLRFYFTLK